MKSQIKYYINVLIHGIITSDTFNIEIKRENSIEDAKKAILAYEKDGIRILGFRFVTKRCYEAKGESGKDLKIEPEILSTSEGWYYPNGVLFSIRDIEEQNINGKYDIVYDNMRFQNVSHAVKTRTGHMLPFEKSDQIILM